MPNLVPTAKAFRELLFTRRELIERELPVHRRNVDRFINGCARAFLENPALSKCSESSLVMAVVSAATYGLEPSGLLGEAYLIPYKDKAVFVPGYRGMIQLARRSGEISTIQMECVYRGDHFDYDMGDSPFIKHRRNDSPDAEFNSSEVTHVYCIVVLKSGGIQRSVWPRRMLEKHRDRYSRAYQRAQENGQNNSTWHSHFDIMAKKTVFRSLINRGEIPVSIDLQEMLLTEEASETKAGTVEVSSFSQGPVTESDLSDPKGEDSRTVDVPSRQVDNDVQDAAVDDASSGGARQFTSAGIPQSTPPEQPTQESDTDEWSPAVTNLVGQIVKLRSRDKIREVVHGVTEDQTISESDKQIIYDAADARREMKAGAS